MEYNLRHNAKIVDLAYISSVSRNSIPLKFYFAKIYNDTEFLDTIKFPQINQKVKYQNKDFWVLEIDKELCQVLIKNTMDDDHPEYNDYWVFVNEIEF